MFRPFETQAQPALLGLQLRWYPCLNSSGPEEVGDEAAMSTRKLIGVSLIVGLAILVAGTVQLLMIVG